MTRVLLALLLVLASVSVFRASSTALGLDGSGDFGMSLKAAETLQRENPYARYFREKASMAELEAETNAWAMMPMQVPSVLMLLWPFGGLDWPSAKLAWLVSNLAFTAGAAVLATRRFLPRATPQTYLAIASLFVISFPWRLVIGGGQHLIAGMFFFLLSMELSRRGHRLWAGVALALCFVKYTVTLFLLPYLVWERRWLTLGVAFGLHAAMTLGVALWLDESPVALVVEAHRAALAFKVGDGGLQVSDGFIDLFAIASHLGAPLFIPTALALAGTGATCWLAVRRRGDKDMFLALLCFWSLVAVYHRGYDGVILLLPLLFAFAAVREERVLVGLILATMASFLVANRFVIQYTDWLGDQGARRHSLYYTLVAGLYYATMLMLFWRQYLDARRGTGVAVPMPGGLRG